MQGCHPGRGAGVRVGAAPPLRLPGWTAVGLAAADVAALPAGQRGRSWLPHQLEPADPVKVAAAWQPLPAGASLKALAVAAGAALVRACAVAPLGLLQPLCLAVGGQRGKRGLGQVQGGGRLTTGYGHTIA